MKAMTLVAKHLYFGLDPLRLRDAANRVLARLPAFEGGPSRDQPERRCRFDAGCRNGAGSVALLCANAVAPALQLRSRLMISDGT